MTYLRNLAEESSLKSSNTTFDCIILEYSTLVDNEYCKCLFRNPIDPAGHVRKF